jgi:hypothetical protein
MRWAPSPSSARHRDGSVQAVAIAPTPQAANAADTGPPNDTQNPFLVFTVVIMAIPFC